ncbi:MAG TPA: hypothetical protein VEW64_03375 [Methyloceanibacter sp.]|jgi:hypothetical protein|nr:hypothetical protein [Methyloceanibacter sp.]
MSHADQAMTASKSTPKGNSDLAGKQDQSERFTPLLSREHYTFSRMKIDRGGPRAYSAICFRGWSKR